MELSGKDDGEKDDEGEKKRKREKLDEKPHHLDTVSFFRLNGLESLFLFFKFLIRNHCD